MARDRSRQQVANYNIKRNTWAIITMILFVIDALCVCLFGLLDTWVVLAIMAVLSIAALASALQIRDTSKEEQLAIVENPDPVGAETIKAGLRSDERLLCADGQEAEDDADANECYVMSDDVNHAFVRFPVAAAFKEGDYELPGAVIPYAGILKDSRNDELPRAHAIREDKSVTGLATDITAILLEEDGSSIEVLDLTRYSVQVTDDAFNKIIVNKKKVANKVVFDGRKLALAEDGSLLGFAESGMANEIDIHSLIISSDGYLMIAKGTDDHPLRKGEIISSASCSLLPHEIDGRPIQESMIDSIHSKIRTLFEIPDNTEMRSSFCGMSRMVKRGGAPEFYCVTRIDLSREALVAAHKDPTSTFASEEIGTYAIETGDADTARGLITESIKGVREKTLGGISLSASAMLQAIMGAMDDAPTAGKVLRRIGIIEDEADVA